MKIIETLEQAGIAFYFVGGYVRDKILNRKSNDIDLVVSEPLEEIFPLIGGKKILVKGNLIRLLDDNVEISRLKGTLEEDLRSRDFTINALAIHPEGQYIDFVGGVEDCKNGVIRAISEDNLVDDFCRTLKGVRQAAELGFTIDSDTKGLITKHSNLIRIIAPERIMLELNKIILLPKPSIAFELLSETGLLKELMPGLARHTLHTVDNTSIEGLEIKEAMILRLAALGHNWGKHEKESVKLFSQFLRNLTYGNRLIAQVSLLIGEHMKQRDLLKMSDYEVRKFLFKNRGMNLNLLLRLFFAVAMARGIHIEDDLREKTSLIRKRFEDCRLKELQINGSDILEHSDFIGPDIGRVKDQLQQMVLERPEINQKETLLGILKRIK